MAKRTADTLLWRHVDRIVAAGTTEVMEICEPLAEAASGTLAHAPFLKHWTAGRAAYVDGRFAEAVALFEAAAALKPGDGPCRVLIARCIEFARNGVPAGWDGSWHFDLK